MRKRGGVHPRGCDRTGRRRVAGQQEWIEKGETDKITALAREYGKAVK